MMPPTPFFTLEYTSKILSVDNVLLKESTWIVLYSILLTYPREYSLYTNTDEMLRHARTNKIGNTA